MFQLCGLAILEENQFTIYVVRKEEYIKTRWFL
jgi:hypothetical protein